jgi:hypothetical protein
VYRSHADGVPEFIEVAAPTEEGLHELLQTVIARLMRLPTRRGVLVEDDGQSALAESDTDAEEARTLRPLQAGAVTYRIAFGPRAPLEFLQRLAALAPRPRLHLIRHHGVLAPNAKLRARLLKRVFDIDVRRCLTCGAGELKIIAAILQRAAIGKILTHLGLDPGRRPGDRRVRRGSRATSERAGRAVSSSASRSAT